MKEQEQDKKKIKPKKVTGSLEQPVIQSPYYNPEVCKIGEVVISSEVLNAYDLTRIAMGVLKDKDVKEYLGVVDFKKKTGTYLG